MGKTYKQPGEVLEHVASGAIAAGDVVVMGDIVGLALVAIADTESGSVSIEGVHTVPKVAGVAWAQGDSLDWDASAGAFSIGITPAAGDVENCAIAAKAAGSADTTGEAKLTPGTGLGA